MADSASAHLLARILKAYQEEIGDETFNGIKLQEVDEGFTATELKASLTELITKRNIDLISSETQLNPHIKRHPAWPPARQVEVLNIHERYHTCLYPTPGTIAANCDLISLDAKPFSKMLAAGAEQLRPIFFELGVLDRYRLDPRYRSTVQNTRVGFL